MILLMFIWCFKMKNSMNPCILQNPKMCLWSGSISINSKLMELCVKWIVLISLVLFNVYSWLIVDNGWIKGGKPYEWSIGDCLDFWWFWLWLWIMVRKLELSLLNWLLLVGWIHLWWKCYILFLCGIIVNCSHEGIGEVVA